MHAAVTCITAAASFSSYSERMKSEASELRLASAGLVLLLAVAAVAMQKFRDAVFRHLPSLFS